MIQALLSKPLLLYVYDLSPYFKQTYVSPDPSRIHCYVGSSVSDVWNVSPEWLLENRPSVVRLLQAERLVVSQYHSPDKLEVGKRFGVHELGVFSSDCDNLSISIIASTILELFQGMTSSISET